MRQNQQSNITCQPMRHDKLCDDDDIEIRPEEFNCLFSWTPFLVLLMLRSLFSEIISFFNLDFYIMLNDWRYG